MNAGSLSLSNSFNLKFKVMKTSIILKVFLILPLILFVDYILMVIIGCSTCLLGFGNDFYCGSYCIFGKLILGLSALIFGYLMYPEIVHSFKMLKNATSTKKQESL